MLAVSSLHADTLYWDASPVTADGTSQGGAGTWDTSTGNWDNGVTYQLWNNSNNDTAVFGGTAGTVTLGADVTVGGLDFAANNYIIDPGAGTTLTFGTAGIINNGGAATINAIIAGSGTSTITKTGNGTLVLNGANTFTGDLTISGGVVRIGTNNLNNGAVLGSTGTANEGSYAGDISVASGAEIYFQARNTTQTLTGVISGAGDLRKGSGGTLILGDQHTYTGKTRLLATNDPGGRVGLGDTEISSFNSINETETGAVLASSSLGAPTNHVDGTIDFGTSVQTSASMRYVGSGETTNRILRLNFNSSGGLTIDNDSTSGGLLRFTSTVATNGNPSSGSVTLRGDGDGQFDGGLNFGFANFNKLDNGSWILGGALGATNNVDVQGGTLALDGGAADVGNTFRVRNSATLTGSGSFGGNITTENSATLAPGSSISTGQMTILTSLGLGASTTTQMELGGTTLGTSYDNITLDVAAALVYGGNLIVDNFGAFDMDAVGFTYDLFTLNGVTPTGDFDSVTVNGVSLINGGGTWTGSNGGVDYVFSQALGDLSVIPEPSAALLGGLGALLLLRRRR